MLADGLYKASLLDGLRDLALGIFGPLQLGLNLLSRLKYGDWPSVLCASNNIYVPKLHHAKANAKATTNGATPRKILHGAASAPNG